MLKQQTYLYPRLHSSVHLLIKDLFLTDEIKTIPKKYQSFSQLVLEPTLFNEQALGLMKSVARLKLLHIGLQIVRHVFLELANLESSTRSLKIKLKMIEIVLKDSSNFRAILIKNVQMPKNQLHETAKEVKKAIIAVIEQLKESVESKEGQDHSQACKELFSSLLISLFGPNSLSHFSPKKNQDLYMPLASVLTSE